MNDELKPARKKVNYNNKHYKCYKPKYRHGLSTTECILVWSISWLVFIAFLCLIFGNGGPLLLLFIWFAGMIIIF